MADPLSPADRSALQAERGPVNMTVAGPLVFRRAQGVTYEAVAERVAARLHLVPRYRQKLASPAPVGLANPVWVDDDAFDLHWHLRRVALPSPGTEQQLCDHMARELSRRLDRTRPLWELHVIEGLVGDRVALLPKMHHALVDGLAAVGIGMLLLDPSAEPLPVPPPEQEWEPRSFDRRRWLTGMAALPLARAQRLVVDAAQRALDTSPRSAAEDLRRATELAAELARSRPQAPMMPLNRAISPNRRFAIASVRLSDLKAAGKAAGGTLNDAVLAAVTGMLRDYLDAAGLTVERAPVALVPVSVRRDEDREQLGNRISMVFVDLPVDEPEPSGRIARIAEQMRELRSSAAVRAGALLVGATGQVPPLVSSVLVRAMSGVRAFNLVVSNVPGPQQPFYANGARLLEVYPAVPLNPANQGLSVGVVSYDGGVFFGLLADARLEPPVELARETLEGALEALAASASA